jgi:hypothetical protein
MNHEEDNREQEKKMNQSARDMEHQEAAQPQDEQQNRNSQERSESHISSASMCFRAGASAKIVPVNVSAFAKSRHTENPVKIGHAVCSGRPGARKV